MYGEPNLPRTIAESRVEGPCAFGMAGQHSTFIAAGDGVRREGRLDRQVRVIDVAPTICYLT